MNHFFYQMNGGSESREDSAQKEVANKQNTPGAPPSSRADETLLRNLRRAIAMTRQFFFDHQHPDGHWAAELEGDASYQSETILLLAFLGREENDTAAKCAAQLLCTQQEDGGWAKYPGGESNLDDTVKAYFALKLTGHDPASESMCRARIRVLELGGAGRTETWTRLFLAILGQVPTTDALDISAQMMLLPKYSRWSAHALCRRARSILIPLSIVSALAPVRSVSVEKGIRELFLESDAEFTMRSSLGRMANTLYKSFQRIGLEPFRRTGLEKAKRWLLDRCRQGGDEDFHSIVWTWIALTALGFADDSEEVRGCHDRFEALIVRDDSQNRARIQPFPSKEPDTLLTLKALLTSGVTPSNPAVRKGVQWIRSHRIGAKDEKNNADLAMALSVLADRFDEARISIPRIASRGKSGEPETGGGGGRLPPDLRLVAIESAESVKDARLTALGMADTTETLETELRRLLALQGKDGGWSAFGCDNRREVPYDLFGSGGDVLSDCSTADVTGRVLESLGRLGFRVGQNTEVDRAVEFLKKCQRSDGSWSGRWGVNHLYGTWLALTGLAAVGVPADDPAIIAGANWLVVHQHSSGGWGESPASYENPSLRGYGSPTASQTAWAVMGLLAAGRLDDPAVVRGVRFLLDRQRDDGTWYEPEFTGTALPGRSYLKHHYYSVYFPLAALAAYASGITVSNVKPCEEMTILRMEKVRLFAPEDNSSDILRPEEFRRHEIPKAEPKRSRPCDPPPILRLFLG